MKRWSLKFEGMNKRIRFINFLPGIAWFFIILFLTCLPGKDLPKIGWLDGIYFDKWVHIGLFGFLTFLFSFPIFKSALSFNKKIYYLLIIAILCSLWGLAIEFIQKYLVTGRTFDLVDWAADSFGVLIACWFCRSKLQKIDTETES